MRLFLSRNSPGDFFSKLSGKLNILIQAESCISLQLKSGLTLPDADWIFFLSPSGVALFQSKFDTRNFRIGVIGPGTEKAVIDQGWKVDFVPQSTDPEEGILEFAKKLDPTENVIMACSDKSLKRMHGIIPEHQLIEWEFYENRPGAGISKTDADYLIFTSPSNAGAYLDSFDLAKNQTAVAIGKTTDHALAECGIQKRIRAEHPAEESIWAVVLEDFFGSKCI